MGAPNTLFRSAEMSLTQLYISNEIGREVVSALGEIGEVQFRDVSTVAPGILQFSGILEIRQLYILAMKGNIVENGSGSGYE